MKKKESPTIEARRAFIDAEVEAIKSELERLQATAQSAAKPASPAGSDRRSQISLLKQEFQVK